MSLELTSDMKLNLGMLGNSLLLSQTVPLGQWNTIYLTYAGTHGGYGTLMAYLNGGSMNGVTETQNALQPSDFSTNDIIKIGGAFKGQLKRVQIYSPGAFGITSGRGIFLSFF